MRTNIVIDDELLSEAMKASGAKTKREAVELGLAALVKLKRQENIRQFRGKLKWEGNLEDMRLDG
ncbi:MAG: type II toxin-antitoxin system VapB family antitoxin [Synechococcus sp.]